MDTEEFLQCEPIYESMPGWQSNTYGVTRYEDLPDAAKAYIKRLETLCELPISIVSTGPDRAHTIHLQSFFDSAVV